MIATPTEGTYPRGETKSEDLKNERTLYEQTDIRNSHAILVSAIQQKLQSVCFRDSVQVIEAMRIERSKQALHLTSRVEGRLLPMLHALDVLAVTIPPFSVTGISQKQVTRYLENGSHMAGIFGDALGFIGFNGHLDFALTAQSIVVEHETMYMQSTITMTKYTNIPNVLQQVQEEERDFLQLLVNDGGRN